MGHFLQAFLSDVVSPGDGIVNGPLVDGVKVPASVKCAEVGPEVARLVAVFGVFAESEDANIACAHQVDSNSLETVVC